MCILKNVHSDFMEEGQSVRFVYHKNWKLWNSDKYNAGGALCILNGLQSGFMEKSRRSKETFSERSAAVKEQCLIKCYFVTAVIFQEHF